MAAADDDAQHQLARIIAGVARETGGTVQAYPRPGRAVRRVVLRDTYGDRGHRFAAAQLEDDGTLRITGHDRGPGVSEFFGEEITSYDWVYVIAPDRVGSLARLLGGQDSDDVLALLAAYYRHTGGRLSDLLKSPEIATGFSNWRS
jgi:hypothetical protein